MILIADSGSTKTDWVLTEADGHGSKRFSSIGYNPYFTSTDQILASLKKEVLPHTKKIEISEIHFYGAGCSTEERKSIVKNALKAAFPDTALIFVGHDLLAAARALLGKKEGFAAILGTGCNTCLYDGSIILLNIDSLGYLLGDEGSGSYIGRRIVRDFMRGRLDSQMYERFKTLFKIKHNEEILKALYDSNTPNRYLASFFPLAVEFADNEYVIKLVKTCFEDFFENLVTQYPSYKNYSFNCIGSVAFLFSDILKNVANNYGMQCGLIIKSPLDQLLAYHCDSK